MSVHFQTILPKLPFGPISAFADEISGDFDEQLSELNQYGVTGLDLRTAFGKNVMALSDEELDVLAGKASAAGGFQGCWLRRTVAQPKPCPWSQK